MDESSSAGMKGSHTLDAIQAQVKTDWSLAGGCKGFSTQHVKGVKAIKILVPTFVVGCRLGFFPTSFGTVIRLYARSGGNFLSSFCSLKSSSRVFAGGDGHSWALLGVLGLLYLSNHSNARLRRLEPLRAGWSVDGGGRAKKLPHSAREVIQSRFFIIHFVCLKS